MFRRMRSGRQIVCFLCLLCYDGSSASAQAPRPYRPPAEFTRQTLFSIPFFLNPNGPPPAEVQLYVSGDSGNTWTLYQRRQPQQGRFDFQAGKDGEYCFAVRTSEDLEAPAGTAAVEKIVVVDRTAPDLNVNVRVGHAGELLADYRATDPNLDARSLRLTYRTNGEEPWQPVPLSHASPESADALESIEGLTSWAVLASANAIEIRAEVTDRAGNRSEWQQEVPPLVNSRLADSPPAAAPVGPEPPMAGDTNKRPTNDSLLSSPEPRTTPTSPAASPEPTASPEPEVGWPSPLPELPPTRTFTSDWPETTPTAPSTPPITSRPAVPATPLVGPEPRRSTDAPVPSTVGPGGADFSGSGPTAPVEPSASAADTGPLPWLEDVTSPAGEEIPGWRSTATRPLAPAPSSTTPVPSHVPPSRPSAAPNQTSAGNAHAPLAGAPPIPEQRTPLADTQPSGVNARPPREAPATVGPPADGAATPHPPQDAAHAQTPGPVLDRYSPPVANRMVPDEPPPGTVVHMTNSRRFNLDYDVSGNGPQPVARVELWMTTNQGSTWQPYGIDPDVRSPFLVELDGEGTYGFRMLIHNQDGSSARPPQPGDTADLWIGVDWTLPEAELLGAEVTGEPSSPTVHIQWRADDKHLDEAPIRLSYAPTAQGPWSLIEQRLANTGSYTWVRSQPLPARTYLQVEVTDRAGNVRAVQSSEPIGAAGRGPQGILRGIRPATR